MKKIAYLRYKELLIGIIVSICAVAYLIGSLSILRTDIVSLGAEFMPGIYGFFLLFLGICQIAVGLKSLNYRFIPFSGGEPEIKDTKKVILTFFLIILYIAVMKSVGFILSSIVFLFLLTLILSPVSQKKNYPLYISFAIILPIITWFIFYSLMNIDLPFGFIFGG